LAAPDHSGVAPRGRRLSSGPEDRRTYPSGRLRSHKATGGIRTRAPHHVLYVSRVRVPPSSRSWTLRSFRFPTFPIRLWDFGWRWGVDTGAHQRPEKRPAARCNRRRQLRRRLTVGIRRPSRCPWTAGLQPGRKVWPEPCRNSVRWGMAICNRSSFQIRNEG